MRNFGDSSTGVPAFLAKLWRLVEDKNTNNLISWTEDGLSFVIQNQAQFAREVLPMNYKHNNMASFIRQLNMYGFHKVSSIDNGGLKFDKDEIEFAHPCFKRGYPYLLEHIRRKITNAKPYLEENETSSKQETFSKVLNEVKAMRGRQDTLDSRFSSMKVENEALWREIAILRQQHMKQQQIVNKLIQFLVTIVQPSRNMSGVKRHFPLMIDDVPESSKLKKLKQSNSGVIIRELTEGLLDEITENNEELSIRGSPNILSPENNASNFSLDYTNIKDEGTTTNTEDISNLFPSQNKFNNEIDDNGPTMNYTIVPSNNEDQMLFHITEIPDQQVKTVTQENSEKSNTKRTKCSRSKKSNLKNKTKNNTTTSSTASQNKLLANNNEKVDPLLFLKIDHGDDSINVYPKESSTKTSDIENKEGTGTAEDIFSDKNGFMNSNEIPADWFEDTLLNNPNLASGSSNKNPQLISTSTYNLPSNKLDEKNLNITKYNPSEDIISLKTPKDFSNHIEGFQEDIDNLKDLLRNDTYGLDYNTILGNMTSDHRVVLSSPLDGEFLFKLFGDSDVLSSNLPNYGMENANKGLEVMAYQPNYTDFSDILDLSEDSLSKNTADVQCPSTPKSVLNTPYHV